MKIIPGVFIVRAIQGGHIVAEDEVPAIESSGRFETLDEVQTRADELADVFLGRWYEVRHKYEPDPVE